MANSKSSPATILGIIAIILVIAAAAYYLMNEVNNDDSLEIEIGLADDEAPRMVVSSRYVEQGSPIVLEG